MRPGTRGSQRRTAIVLLVAVVLVGAAVVLVRQPGMSLLDVARRGDAARLGCPSVGGSSEADAELIFTGEVAGITDQPNGGALVDFSVDEWYVGPPLRYVDAALGATDLALLRSGGLLGTGSRVVVQGAAWSEDGSAPRLSCGDIVRWDADLAEDLRSRHPVTQDPPPDGPLALYPSVPFSRTAPLTSPVLRGVLTVRDGCLLVQDGDDAWLPLFPAGETSWDSASRTVRFDGRTMVTGMTVRLAGSPAQGLVPRRGQALTPQDRSGLEVEAGRAGPCRGEVPEFVVAVAPSGPATVHELDGSQLAQRLSVAIEDAGVDVRRVDGRLRSDRFDGSSLMVEVELAAGSGLGRSLTARTDSASRASWPAAYLDDELFTSRPGPEGCGTLPDQSTVERSIVQRADGTTRLLLHPPGRPLVMVTADAEVPGGDLCLLRRVASALGPP